MGQVKVDEYEYAKLKRIADRAINPEAPKVKKDTVIVVQIHYGDGSEENPSGIKSIYYRSDGAYIGEIPA
jgi:hypothetical protein